MDWQLCLKPALVRPQDLCELNVNAVPEMLCKSIERMDGWKRDREKKGEGKQEGGGKKERQTQEKRETSFVPSKTGV